MYVVSNASAILCGIVASEYSELFSLAYCHLQYIWHQVVGNTVRIFPCTGSKKKKLCFGIAYNGSFILVS